MSAEGSLELSDNVQASHGKCNFYEKNSGFETLSENMHARLEVSHGFNEHETKTTDCETMLGDPDLCAIYDDDMNLHDELSEEINMLSALLFNDVACTDFNKEHDHVKILHARNKMRAVLHEMDKDDSESFEEVDMCNITTDSCMLLDTNSNSVDRDIEAIGLHARKTENINMIKLGVEHDVNKKVGVG